MRFKIMGNKIENNKAYTVYMHISPNGKRYIGITKQKPERRWRKNGEGYARNAHFWNAILKYGWDNFKHEILFDNLPKEKAETLEIDLISLYKSNDFNFGYNLDKGGNCLGSFSKEHKQKISNALKGNKNCLGRVLPLDIRNKISASNKGKIGSMKGKKFTAEHKQKISNSRKGKYSGENNARSIKVVCVETGETYVCIADVFREKNIDSSSITAVCKGRRKTAGGYHWRYVNE